MATYVALLKLTAEGAKAGKGVPERRKAAIDLIKKLGGKVVADYVLFGPHDFLIIIDGLDDEKMLQVSLAVSCRGTTVMETYRAFPFKTAEAILKRL
jgi:uncharacterized protein with GYD domain